jgi:DNA polymerase I
MSNQTKPLILVDGSSYLYRAFHALPALTNSKGFPTGAVYGIINMIKKLKTDYDPDYMAVIFDAKGKTFRDELYAEYKATRQDMPGELVQQIEPIHHIIRALGIPLLMIEGVEADDVIGTLAKAASKEGISALISTGDKDLAQLVNENVTLINTMTNTILDPAGVEKKFDVTPELIIDYLTLVGDSSDNIPGVPQVGPKTAAKWLKQYGSLDNIIANADNISGRVGENLRASLTHIPLTKTLVTIKKDVELPLHYFDLKLTTADKSTLIHWFTELEFRNWLNELLEERKQDRTEHYAKYLIIDTEKKLDDWLQRLTQAELFSFAVITNAQTQLIGFSFAIHCGEAVYIPVGHQHGNQLARELILKKLTPLLADSKQQKICHNFKFNLEVLANQQIDLQGVVYDTLLESYVLDSTSLNHDLETLSLKYLGRRMISFQDIAGKDKHITLDQIDIQKAGIFAAEDADVILDLHTKLWARIHDQAGLKYIYEKIELPLSSVLAHMECYGVLIDPDNLQKQGEDLQKSLNEKEQEAYTLADTIFNINSPKQLQEILFQKLKLPVLQKTATGQPSTADNVLQELALDFALPRLIIDYRKLSKLISTYTHRLIEQINPKTGRLHTTYNQAGTSTGRLSSVEPNLQNIPIRSREGRRIRQAFIAPRGYKMLSADYSQIELRLMAHISQDPNLVKAFLSNIDIHKATAAEVAGVSLEQVTADMRRNAKVINFGILYGMSAFGLMRELGIDKPAAQKYIELYFSRYPKVKDYMDQTRSKAKKDGYVETLWGRRLYVPDINASQIPRQRAAERMAQSISSKR